MVTLPARPTLKDLEDACEELRDAHMLADARIRFTPGNDTDQTGIVPVHLVGLDAD